MKRVIIQIDAAKEFLSYAEMLFDATADSLTRSKRQAFQQKLDYFQNRINAAEETSEYSYHQETLEELEDDT